MKTITKSHRKRRISRKPVVTDMRYSAEGIRELRVRLSPVSERPVSQQRFSHLLGVSWSTVARWEGGGQPDPPLKRKLIRLRQTLDALGDMVRPEHRLAFLEQNHPLLLSLRPIDLLDTEKGTEAVLSMLRGAESGAFA